MDGRLRDDFLINALALLSADIFFHPLWLRTPMMDPIEAGRLASELTQEVKSLAAQQDWLSACRVCLARAYLLNLSGSRADALESLRWVDQMARRGSLPAAVIWAGWGASAVCVQAGDYSLAADYLGQLQQDLYCEGHWVLANVMELALQSIREWAAAQGSARHGTPPLNRDRTGLLIEQMLSWGTLPAEIAGEVIAATEHLTGTAFFAPSDAAPDIPEPQEVRGRSFWQTLLMVLRGELRLGLVEVNQQSTVQEARSLPALSAPHAEAVLPGRLKPARLPPRPNGGDSFLSYSSQDLPAKASTVLVLPGEVPLPPAEPTEPVEAARSVSTVEPEGSSSGEPAAAQNQSQPDVAAQTGAIPLLRICLLGNFSVMVGETEIEEWPSGRSRAVFAYLLAHHDHPVPREVLMETFWPEAPLDSARNNLNVAVYTLRHTLRTLLKTPVILLNAYSAYQINPDLPLWVDSEVFERHVCDAKNRETSGAVGEAVIAYQEAVSLYLGDFLADAPFEGWATLERERLRILYLDVLDRLSFLYFNQGQYKTCMDLCQRILSYDACREDAHCRLMRCYTRQGQAHLALRQYQICVESLRMELDVPPSPATTLLYEQIKRREAV